MFAEVMQSLTFAMDMAQVCRSWIHFTDGLLLPPANRASRRWDSMWLNSLPWSSVGPSLELKCLMGKARIVSWFQKCLSHADGPRNTFHDPMSIKL